MTPNPNPTTQKTPATAPLGALLAGAAVAAVQAIIPLAGGAQPNYALLAATFLVTFGATIAAALYHLQLPSGVQQAAITEMAAALSQHTHTAVVVSTAGAPIVETLAKALISPSPKVADSAPTPPPAS